LDNIANDRKSVAVVQNIFAFPVFGNFTLADKDVFAFMRAYPDFRDRMPSIAKERNIPVLDRMDYVCDRANELCYGVNSNIEKLFYDYGHHTLAGARFFGKRLDQLRWLGVLSSNKIIGTK